MGGKKEIIISIYSVLSRSPLISLILFRNNLFHENRPNSARSRHASGSSFSSSHHSLPWRTSVLKCDLARSTWSDLWPSDTDNFY